MISLFEVALEELEANFHIPTYHRASPATAPPAAAKSESFPNEPPNVYAFSAASAGARPRLPVWNLPEIIPARERRDSTARRVYAAR